ncbi:MULTISPECIES: tyrosine-type recombinase/integrase [Pseudomonas]|uniref:tyrosine-type recombinase/integrase n=1 Tax=Pseudomonas sp. BF-RE-29 TaxID=2832378 RepID=UPI001CBC258B|nr:site-specific integrase [Pseudomonas sp. BF-RE-29]
MAISDAWLKANNGKPRSKREEKSDRDGFGVRVTPKGKITFQLRFRYDYRPCRLDLGTYPLMSLKEARTETQRLRAQLEQGYDPRVVKQLEKQAILQADSVESLFRQWYETYCKGNKKGHQEILRSFELHVFPRVGKLPAGKVTLHEWLALLEGQAKVRPGIAERILVNAKQMLKWGVKRRLIPSHPLSEINAKEDLQIKKISGSRSLSDEEIKLVWKAMDQSRMATKNKIFLKLCLIYGCRNSELRLSEKRHFDFAKKIWTVPIANHKLGKASGKPLLRPIPPEIEVLIKHAMSLSAEGEFLFTNSGTIKPMGAGAPLQLPYNIMQWLRRHEKYEMQHWSVHDLRKTARTNFSTLTEPHIAEIMLGHKLPGSWQVYDQYDYLTEQKDAYIAWWQRLTALTV